MGISLDTSSVLKSSKGGVATRCTVSDDGIKVSDGTVQDGGNLCKIYYAEEGGMISLPWCSPLKTYFCYPLFAGLGYRHLNAARR